MKMKKINWNRWRYRMGKEIHECPRCGLERRVEQGGGEQALLRCEQCGETMVPSMVFGGLRVIYNRVKDNFILQVPSQPWCEVYVDNADVPDTIAFMNKHFRLEGWGVDDDVWLEEGE